MIVETRTANCDEKGCGVVEEINPGHTQPYGLLTKMGWSIVTGRDDIRTYCPDHPHTDHPEWSEE